MKLPKTTILTVFLSLVLPALSAFADGTCDGVKCETDTDKGSELYKKCCLNPECHLKSISTHKVLPGDPTGGSTGTGNTEGSAH